MGFEAGDRGGQGLVLRERLVLILGQQGLVVGDGLVNFRVRFRVV